MKNLKKRQVFLATIIICCVFLGIGFYAGWATKSLTGEKSESNFDKQKECMSYYNIYKDKLSYVSNSKLSYLDSLSVSYSPSLDTCIASWIVWTELSENSEMYEFEIINVGKADSPIYRCYVNRDKQDDECWMHARKNALDSLLY